MANALPRLRMNLDFMPSPMEDRPGLLIRDPFDYSDVTLIIPPVLVQVLEYFDGERTEQDLRAALYEITGDLTIGQVGQQLQEALEKAGFLDDATYAQMRETREREFAESPTRLPAHAGAAYPDEPEELRGFLDRYFEGAERDSSETDVIGIAAPHVSPEGGWQSYRAAYSGLRRDLAESTFVVLGTSHHGMPERFGLTRKTWTTPWGEAQPASALIEELAAKCPSSIAMEDYVHSVEHSIEFQIIFLQHLFGANIKVLPILCGTYARSIYDRGMPEDDENVKRFLETLGEMGAREGNKLFWVLGVDMAHMGRRYGDQLQAQADTGEMAAVAHRDKRRIESINAGDAKGYWDQVQDQHDDLKWCGASPFYTFMKAMPQARGTLERYEQWNIDPTSVVSFAGMKFRQ